MKGKILERARDYATEQPSFTSPFMAWEMGISPSAAVLATRELLRLGIIEEIEPRQGPYAAVYAYKPIEANGNGHKPKSGRLFAELDDARVGELAPARGKAVPHVRPIGPSGKPGLDKQRGNAGRKVKRVKQGT